VFVQREIISIQLVNVCLVKLDVRHVQMLPHVVNVYLHYLFKLTIVLLDVLMVSLYQVQYALHAHLIVQDVLLLLLVSIVQMELISMVDLVIINAHLELLPIEIHSTVYHVTLHVKHAPIIQVHVPVVNQELVSYKLQELIKHVLNNVLMELILKIMYVKYAILNAQNVLELLLIVSHVQLVDSFIIVPVGIRVQEL
jgi:hypothetical protein